MLALQRLLTISAESNLAAGLLAEAAHVRERPLLQPIRERFVAAAAAIDRNVRQLPDLADKERLERASGALLAFGTGEDNIFAARERELRAIAAARESLQTKREEMTVALKSAHEALLDTLIPVVDDATFELVLAAEDGATRETEAMPHFVDGGVMTIHRLLTVNAQSNLAAGLLAEAAHVDDVALIQPIRERFFAAAAAVERNLRQLPDMPEKEELQQASQALLALGAGEDNIFAVRERELRHMAEARDSLQARREDMVSALKATHSALLDTLVPMIDDASFDLVITSEEVTAESTEAITSLIDVGVTTLRVLLTVRAEGNLAAGLLNEAAGVLEPARLQPLRERFIAAISRIERMLAQLPEPADDGSLREAAGVLVGFGSTDDSIFDLRRQELDRVAAAQTALASSRELAISLGEAVAGLVTAAQGASDAAALQSADAIGRARLLMIVIAAASVLGAGAVVLFYVRPRIVAPLASITAAMSDLAAGDTSVDIPGRDRGDEIGRMAQALGVFRDTAIEVQKSNLSEIREARRRLTDAIETISEGFSLYDSEDRLVVCNSMYRKLLYPGIAAEITPGMSFEEIVRRAAERGLIEAEDRVEQWLADRLARHRDPGGPHTQRRTDGRWILVSERKTEDGGTVAVYSDITELKQREDELARKSNELEALSSQLAKYLAPQVYESIFTGKQEVKITARRKKLTIFFSDIAGFTETADRLESEDLIQLLNQYLTEMSRIALAYGATIDKYVGDAIVIFFGDPETRGVKADALACVRMAIAMRERMRELESVWRASGIEKPLCCRIGINTGFCTVGNFGSEDRMDYTIIGGGVNLASRLEAAATPGEILISYETYAQIKDQIHCEECGAINVKGVAYPVATYAVVDSYEDLDKKRSVIREDQPNLKLDIDLDAMSAAERSQAASALRRVLARLSAGDESARPKSAATNGPGHSGADTA